MAWLPVPSTSGRRRAARWSSRPPASFGVLFVTEDDAVAWSGAAANQALVLLTDAERSSDNAAATLDSLRQKAVADGASDVYDRAEQPSNSILQEDIDSLHQMAVYFPLLFLLAAGLAIYVLLSRRVAEERQIIGTLRATGVKARPLGWHYLSYALLAGLIGVAIGVPLGTAMAGALTVLLRGHDQPAGVLDRAGGLRVSTVVIGWCSRSAPPRSRPGGRPVARCASCPQRRCAARSRRRCTAESGWRRIVPGSRHFSAKWRLILRNIGPQRRSLHVHCDRRGALDHAGPVHHRPVHLDAEPHRRRVRHGDPQRRPSRRSQPPSLTDQMRQVKAGHGRDGR